jgi:hypothetical protein
MPQISPKLETDLEAFFADTLAVIGKIQSAYAASHGGKFWQGILTPATPPDETTKQRPPDLSKHPTDQSEAWEDVFKGADILPANWPAQLQIDVYDGSLGTGYTITLQASEGGKLQARTWNFGPETHRDSAWFEKE